MKSTKLMNKVLRNTLNVEIKRVAPSRHTYLRRHQLRDLSSFNELENYIERIAKAYSESPLLPDFLKAGSRPLEIPTFGKKVTKIRFEVPAKTNLHLHSITLLGRNNQPIKTNRGVTVTASSYYGESHGMIQSGEIFNAQNKRLWTLHTNRERQPWVTISFTNPKVINAVILRNRRDFQARRAAGLRVLIAGEDERWQEIYTIGGREFTDKVSAISDQCGLYKFEQGDILKTFMISLMLKENQRARKIFKRFPAAFKAVLRDVINEKILNSQGREWTTHGAQRSFRFWSHEEKVEYIKLTNQIIDDLRSLSPDVSLGFGSVLSLIRDRDLMPHDDDLDTIIGFRKSQAANLDKARQLVKEHLEKRGYQLEGDFFSLWHVKRGEQRKVDVFVGIYDDDNTIGWYPGARGALKRSDVFPTKLKPLLGQPCRIPRRPIHYLETIYGKNWKNPDPVWRHNWDKTEYLDLKETNSA